MGYGMFVCRVSGKISLETSRRLIVLLPNKRWRFYDEVKYGDKEDLDKIYYCDYHKCKSIRKCRITEEDYKKLEKDLEETFNDKYVSSRVLEIWNDFWKWIDEWASSRENPNPELIKKIKSYLYPED